MTATPAAHPQHPRPLVLGARRSYLVFAGLFAVGIVLQVFFAGLGVLVDPGYFGWHTTFAHLLELLLIALLVLGVVGRVGWRTFGISALILVIFGMQYAFMYGFEGLLRALHVVNALALFWLALQLGRRAWRLLHTPRVDGEASASNKSFSARHLILGGSAVILGTFVLFSVITNSGPGFTNFEGALPQDELAEADAIIATRASVPGAQLYGQNCAGCHGGAGEGGFGPALAGNKDLADADAVVEQILGGGGGMPAFDQLSEQEVAAVTSHIRSSWGNDFSPASTGNGALER